jgi:hypothetical protein
MIAWTHRKKATQAPTARPARRERQEPQHPESQKQTLADLAHERLAKLSPHVFDAATRPAPDQQRPGNLRQKTARR